MYRLADFVRKKREKREKERKKKREKEKRKKTINILLEIKK